MDKCRIIVVEDVSLEMKGTLSILKTEIPEAQVVGTAMTEQEFWPLVKSTEADLILLDLGLGGSTTIGVDICRRLKAEQPHVKVLIFTGEITNERLWVDALDAGADGIVLKAGELLTRNEVLTVMSGRQMVFNQPVLKRIVDRFKSSVAAEDMHRNALLDYDIDEYDERFLRHLALGYTKDMISELRSMPFSSKSLEKRQADLIARLFSTEDAHGINVTRLVVRAIELHIIDPASLEPNE